jgi:hypothetical protein
VLLSLGNLASRIQYLNASNTFTELFSYGTVPIVNENDTVAVEELRIGDNDTLSAQVHAEELGFICGNRKSFTVTVFVPFLSFSPSPPDALSARYQCCSRTAARRDRLLKCNTGLARESVCNIAASGV